MSNRASKMKNKKKEHGDRKVRLTTWQLKSSESKKKTSMISKERDTSKKPEPLKALTKPW
jgi:hypothetical protein